MTEGLGIYIGAEYKSGTVVAFHEQENHGTAGVVLTIRSHATYVLWTVDQWCRPVTQRTLIGLELACFKYAETVASLLYTHYNRPAPGVSFTVPNNT